MAARLLLLDVGNTNVKFALACPAGRQPPGRSWNLPVRRDEATADFWGFRMLEVLAAAGTRPADVADVVVSSVVPPLDPLLAQAVRRFLDREALFAPRDLPVPLENRYAKPGEVGADRLVASLAARLLNPEPASLIVIDYGTATTFDCVTGHSYLGGLICPGLLSSVEALAARTAKLPRVTLELDSPDIQIGRSTTDSLNQGVLHGFAAMTEGVTDRLRKLLPPPARVVATGGFAEVLAPVCACFDELRPDLIMVGLQALYAQAKHGARA